MKNKSLFLERKRQLTAGLNEKSVFVETGHWSPFKPYFSSLLFLAAISIRVLISITTSTVIYLYDLFLFVNLFSSGI